MERATAIRQLGRLLGKSMGYRVDPKAPSKEDREAARAELVIAVAEHNRLKELKRARFEAILKADAEYQELAKATTTASERASKLRSTLSHHKIEVGQSTGMFFHIKAWGDSWEDVIAKLNAAPAA